MTINVTVGGDSPWGRIQTVHDVAPGIVSVSTAGHGGVWVAPELLAQMPEHMSATPYSGAGWFEEDCDWCLPYVCFEGRIREYGHKWSVDILDKGLHLETFRQWYPDSYERFFSVVLTPGQSHVKDEREWKKAHAGDWQCVSAIGVGDGWVKVSACIGGRSGNGYAGEIVDYMVPKAEYDLRGAVGSFVVDPSRHAPVKEGRL